MNTKPRSISLPVIQKTDEKPAIRESRVSKRRAAVLITLTALMVVHFIQWRIMGRTVSPIEPSESMYTLQNGAINAGFVFFTLAILATLIFGRFVCGWGCHIVALQDFCAWLLKKAGLKPRPFRSRLLVYIPLFAAVYMFIWPSVLRYFTKPANEPMIPEFTNHLMTTEFWATFPPFWVAVPFLFICGFVTVYFLGSKGFCTYACPYGGFFSLADKVAPGRIRVTDACEQCGHCTAVCTSNVIVHAEVKEFGMVVDPGCMKCMDCVSVCPNDALYFGFGKPPIGVKGSVKKNFSLSWPEEIAGVIIFFASFFAVWDVYQLVPMLMALGIAIVATFLALKAWRLLGKEDMAFYGYALRHSGSLTKYGFIFLAAAGVWVGLTIHSGWIHYHESAGTQAYERIRIPDELALAETDPGQWLTPAARANVESGREHLSKAARFGLFTNDHAMPKLAWLEYLSGNTEKSIELLGISAGNEDGAPKALSHYYRGAILNRMGRSAEAIVDLDAALAERPDLSAAREERGEALWNLGKKTEAAAEWNAIIQAVPQLPLANYMLSGAAADAGNAEAAERFEAAGDRNTPKDPYFHWMLGLRLRNLGMNELAEKHFTAAEKLDPAFMLRRKL